MVGVLLTSFVRFLQQNNINIGPEDLKFVYLKKPIYNRPTLNA